MGLGLEIIVPILAAAIGAMAWFLRRRLTPERATQKYDLANKMLDARSKLSAAGYDAEQVDSFVAALENDRTGAKLSSALKALSPESVEPTGPERADILHTTAAMGARVDARLNVVDAEIERVLLDIEILTSHHFAESGADAIRYDPDHVRKMHRAWKLYRKRAAHSASEDYAGGTISGVVYLLEEVRIAEAFLKDMTERLRELTSR
jgi:hypothetical protein